MIVKEEGIVIRTLNYGESSKIITMYTRNHGKVAMMARGAKKNNSRLGAITQIFNYGNYIYYKGKEMGTLNQGDLENRFTDIYQDIEKTAYAAYIVELVDKMTVQDDPNPFLFQQLLSSLESINEGKDKEVVTSIFELKMFMISGYRPRLHSCSVCGREDELTGFSVSHGGLICNQHNEKSIPLQKGTIKLLRLFEAIDMKRLGNIEVKESTKSQLQYVLHSFYEEHIGIPLKSRNFLNQLKNFN